jgi:hypothetical protein
MVVSDWFIELIAENMAEPVEETESRNGPVLMIEDEDPSAVEASGVDSVVNADIGDDRIGSGTSS